MGAAALSLPEAVYRAENKAILSSARQFSTTREMRSWVKDVTESDFWLSTFPRAPHHVNVEIRSGSARFSVAHGNSEEGTIAIANNPAHRNVAVVLHELAHLATRNADGHGPIFRNALLKMVRYYMGFYSYVDLENAYKEEMQ